MSEKEKMLAGKLYFSGGEELVSEHQSTKAINDRINGDWTLSMKEKIEMIKGIVGAYGDNFYIGAPVRFDYGYNLHVGHNFYANFDCIFLDDMPIVIGNNVMLGPRVSLFTASHPTDKDVRNSLLEYSRPITIGDDVWIGGNSVINPGVTIGSDVIIGSGSVVTRDIPSHTLAAGNPCRVLRSLTEDDKIKWEALAKEWHNN